ncbi:MAG: class I SAM-dependent methyltransferase [Anaerolineae bacterium]
MSFFTQSTIERMYRYWARTYELLAPIYLLGNEGRLRAETIRALSLQPGQSVLDVACGTGSNFPLIQERIGPTGTLVGVDYTPAMLDQAQARIQRHGWKNVQLVRSDAAQLALGRQFDAALCTLAMSVIPDWQGALQHMLAHVRPGGRIVIADAKHSSRWYARSFNLIADLLAWGVAGDISRRPWEELVGMVDDYVYREWFMGFFYVAGGRVPPQLG